MFQIDSLLFNKLRQPLSITLESMMSIYTIFFDEVNPSTLRPKGQSLLKVDHEQAFNPALKSMVEQDYTPRIIPWSISLLLLSKNLTFWEASINLKYNSALEEE